MAATQSQAAFKQALLSKVRKVKLTNTASRVDLADVCSDLVNQLGYKWCKDNIELSPATLIRIMACEKPYHIRASTVEKILQASNVEIQLK